MITLHCYVRKTEGAFWEGEVVALYTSLNGADMAVVEVVSGPFKGMQYIYKRAQLAASLPSKAMIAAMMDEGMRVPRSWHPSSETPSAPVDYELYESTDVFHADKGGLKKLWPRS